MAFEFFLKKSGITCPSDSSIRVDLRTLFKIVHHSSSLFAEFNKGTQKYWSRITFKGRSKYEKLFYNSNPNNNT